MRRLQLFRTLILRPLRRDLLRTALTILAVALGVGVVIAIDLAGDAATGSFRSSLETLVGKTDLEIVANGGVDERWMATLSSLPANARFEPVIETRGVIAEVGAVTVYGVDFVARTAGREAGRPLPQNPDADAVISSGLAKRAGLREGGTITVTLNDEARTFRVAGIAEAKDAEFVLLDIATAQQALNEYGKLERIDVFVSPREDFNRVEREIRAVLPAGYRVEKPGTRSEENQRMLRAFRWNLRVLSYISLVVGAFLIYNTIAVSVVRRRPEIGILRALGATQRLVLGGFLAEAAFFGTAGGLLGLGLGRLLALVAVRLIGNTVQALYVSSEPAAVALTWEAVGAGFVIGLGMSLLAALAPAWEASRVAPVEAMARGRREFVARLNWKRNLLGGCSLLMLAAGAALLPPVGHRPVFGYASAVLLVGGTTLLIPVIVGAFARIAAPAAGRWFGIESLLALRSLRGAL